MLLILRSKRDTYAKMKKFNKKISIHLKEKDIAFNFASFEDVEFFLETNNPRAFINGKPLSGWRTIYTRKVGSYRGAAFMLAYLSEKNKVLFIDSFHKRDKDSSDAAKIIQMFRFAEKGVPIPKTYYAVSFSKKQIKNAAKFLGFPIIIKQCNTSQGAGVFMAKNLKELEEILKKLSKDNTKGDTFLQEFLPNDFEYRIFVTGEKIGAAEKKIRTRKNEFRNNVFLGAKEEFLNITKVKKNILTTAIKAARVSGIQICGVDIVESNKKLFVFEANSCPGLTLNEKISPELKSLSDYLEKCEER